MAVFDVTLGSIEDTVKMSLLNEVITGGGPASELELLVLLGMEDGWFPLSEGSTGASVLEALMVLPLALLMLLIVVGDWSPLLDGSRVAIPPGRIEGCGRAGAPDEESNGTQAIPEGPTVMVEVTGGDSATTVVEVSAPLVPVEVVSDTVATTNDMVVRVAKSVYVVGTKVSVMVEPPSMVPVTMVAPEGAEA
jgi:hypothetical protein